MNPLFTRLIDPESVILDIGGHSGQYAKLLARIAKRGRIYAFEPSSYTCSILRLAVRFTTALTTSTWCPRDWGTGPAI